MFRRLYFLFLSILVSTYIYCNPITLNPIGVSNQFPSNSVQRIIQDKDGFLWFGTKDGICRYDGYRVLVFRSNNDNPNLLTNNQITCIGEDHENNIWIGTKEGINILNRETFQITQFGCSSIQKQNIQAIFCASDGRIWIAVDNLTYRYDPKTKTIENLSNKIVPLAGINSFYEDRFGDIWILMWNNGMHLYKKNGKVIHYPPIGIKDNPFRIWQDDKNQYWICTWGDGIYQFYPNNNQDSMYKPFPIYKKDNIHTEDTFFCITQDNNLGYLWLMSFSGIYAIEHTKENTIKQVDVSYLFQGSNNIFSEMIKDRKGNLWVATFDEGAFSLNFDKPDIHNLTLSGLKNSIGVEPNITAIYKDMDNILWLNQDRIGLCLYDTKTNQVKKYSEIDKLKPYDLSEITCIWHHQNQVWLGVKNQPYLYIIEKSGNTIKSAKTININKLHNEPPANEIRQIFEDSKNNIWIIANRYVFIKPYNEPNIKLFSKDLINITNITEDTSGIVWLSSENNGIYKIELNFETNITDFKITNYSKSNKNLPVDNIATICSDQNGNIWLGTKYGNIIRLDVSTLKCEDYTKTCNMIGEAIQDMLVDKNNNLWITTNKRVIVYNKEKGASRDYSTSDGLIVNSFRQGACFFDHNENILYFGGNHGICQFSSKSFNPEENKNVEVLISDIKINGISLLNDPKGEKLKVISKKLNLSPNDKNIEIDFTTLDYTYPEKIIYAYKMEGVDDDWVYTNRQFATYNQLKNGRNIFHVKATDENRIWSSTVTTFEIYKAPAFYETWWAYVLYILITFAFIYWASLITRNKIRLKQELRIAQIEKDKSEDLTQTKLRYFTNISHDLLTPLTIISCMIDDIETMMKQKVQQFEIMRANVNRLKRLLQQVLDFRKIESGNMRLRVTNGDISSFIRDICYNNFNSLFDKKNIQFMFESQPISISGYFDADKIDKIMYNLLSNALKYTPEEGQINVTLNKTQKDKLNYLCITIKDSGIGISSEELSNIFIRFYNNKNIESGQTNGIGLSLTQDLVELHHGTITVSSSLNEGSTFTIQIPIDQLAFSESEIDNGLTVITFNHNSNDDESLEHPDTIELKDMSEKENVNLLLVEDNEDILFTLKNILQRQYNILTASNGTTALNIIKDNDVDIIVSDVMMPEMDGLELCRIIKKDINTSHIPILLLTAKNSVEDRIDCYDAGADGYISKPFEIKLLKSRINNFLINKQEKQQEFKSNVEINISTFNYPTIDEEFLNRSIEIIENHLGDTNFDVDSFANQMSMSKSSLYRKIKTMTGLPPNEFIRNIRLKHACQKLRDKSITISEVAYSVGFTDPRYFSTCFKSEFGMTPSEYQKSM